MVTWDPIDPATENGPLTSYRIRYANGEPWDISDFQEVEVEPALNEVPLHYLTPYWDNFAQIAAVNPYSVGPFSPMIKINTPEIPRKQDMPPFCALYGSTSLALFWLESYTVSHGEVSKYSVLITPREGDTPTTTRFETDKTRLKINDLRPDTPYRIEIVAHGENGDSPASNPAYCMTRKVPSDPAATSKQRYTH